MTVGQVQGTFDAGAATLALPAVLQPFVRRLLSDTALQARLGPVAVPEDFVALAGAAAAELGLAFDAQALDACLHPDPLGLGRWAAAPVTLDHWPAAHWLPARTAVTDTTITFDWAWFGPDRLAEPMFEDSARRATALPLNRLCRTRTSLEALVAAAESAAPPAGFIYHMSRCGSTLLGQMLRAVPGMTVIAEADPLDAVLLWAWRAQAPLEVAVPAVRAVVAALSRPRGIEGERCVFKLDAWHVLLMPLLRAAFPEVPWVYLFRDPVEVLVSLKREPGMHVVAGVMPESLYGIHEGHLLAPAAYTTRVFEAIGQAALTGLTEPGGLAVDYRSLIRAAPDVIASHFGILLDDKGRSAMRAAAHWNAKAPQQAFVDDVASKQAAATGEVLAAAGQLASIHARLLAMAWTDS